jgi:ferredoxin
MPKITINDEIVDAAAGDNLLALARRRALHIWFACDGRGLCRTCECRVVTGAENLSRPTAIEQEALSDSRRDGGYRLACQTRVVGDGAVRVISVAEEIRRQTTALVKVPEGGSWMASAGELAGTLTRLALDFTRTLPSAALHFLPQLVSKPPDLEGMQRYLRDTGRVVERVLRDTRTLGDTAK